ncbi:MAG: Uncharacterized protein XE07_2174 [Methanothrix harundinacea]|uniref:Tetratricopeptide repeat protein n=1 Tax=Methanothrix harundinacea TaxID=301375 RepID=A0A101IFP9_9EURY|nr:MAG: Uncharacterized protein XE07_2174 [Methanothrix harundinacea]
MEKALSIYDQILKDVPRLEPAVRGEVRFRQGLSHYGQSFEGARETNLRRAVEAFEDAIRLIKPEKHPAEHARAQNGLGVSLVRLSEAGGGWGEPSVQDLEQRGKGKDDLKRAIGAFEEALRLYSAEGKLQEHAQTKNNLGDAYLLLSRLEEDDLEVVSDLKKAIGAYEEALAFRTAEEWAETQTLLGQALVLESEPEVSGSEVHWADREGLKMAIEAYEEALAVRTRESRPEEYAETKNLLGRALVILSGPARGPEDAANLKRAIRAFEEALAIRTLEASPMDYAETQNNLGIEEGEGEELRAEGE